MIPVTVIGMGLSPGDLIKVITLEEGGPAAALPLSNLFTGLYAVIGILAAAFLSGGAFYGVFAAQRDLPSRVARLESEHPDWTLEPLIAGDQPGGPSQWSGPVGWT